MQIKNSDMPNLDQTPCAQEHIPNKTAPRAELHRPPASKEEPPRIDGVLQELAEDNSAIPHHRPGHARRTLHNNKSASSSHNFL